MIYRFFLIFFLFISLEAQFDKIDHLKKSIGKIDLRWYEENKLDYSPFNYKSRYIVFNNSNCKFTVYDLEKNKIFLKSSLNIDLSSDEEQQTLSLVDKYGNLIFICKNAVYKTTKNGTIKIYESTDKGSLNKIFISEDKISVLNYSEENVKSNNCIVTDSSLNVSTCLNSLEIYDLLGNLLNRYNFTNSFSTLLISKKDTYLLDKICLHDNVLTLSFIEKQGRYRFYGLRYNLENNQYEINDDPIFSCNSLNGKFKEIPEATAQNTKPYVGQIKEGSRTSFLRLSNNEIGECGDALGNYFCSGTIYLEQSKTYFEPICAISNKLNFLPGTPDKIFITGSKLRYRNKLVVEIDDSTYILSSKNSVNPLKNYYCPIIQVTPSVGCPRKNYKLYNVFDNTYSYLSKHEEDVGFAPKACKVKIKAFLPNHKILNKFSLKIDEQNYKPNKDGEIFFSITKFSPYFNNQIDVIFNDHKFHPMQSEYLNWTTR